MSLEAFHEEELKLSPSSSHSDQGKRVVLTCTGRVMDEVYARMIIGEWCREWLTTDACHRGELAMLASRLTQTEKEEIAPDQVYVYCQEDSDIQRWTDGRLWAPSKIVGNFLHYHELYRRYSPYQKVYCAETNKVLPKFHPQDMQDLKAFQEQNMKNLAAGEICVRLKGMFVYKKCGLLKKTYTMKIVGKTYHLVAYEAKAPQ